MARVAAKSSRRARVARCLPAYENALINTEMSGRQVIDQALTKSSRAFSFSLMYDSLPGLMPPDCSKPRADAYVHVASDQPVVTSSDALRQVIELVKHD